MVAKYKKSKSGSNFILLMLIAFVVWFFASPFVFLYNLRQDAINGRTEELREKVDFQRLREDLKGQVANYYAVRDTPSNDVFSGLTSAIAPQIANKLIDGLVTPNGIVRFAKSGNFSGNDKKANQKPMQMPSVGMNWQNPNSVIIELKTKTEGKTSKIGIRLARRNIISWKITGLELPMEELVK